MVEELERRLKTKFRLYIEVKAPREVLENAIGRALNVVASVDFYTCPWGRLYDVEGYFPTLNSNPPKFEVQPADLNLIAIPLNSDVVEVEISNVQTRSFEELSKTYFNLMEPSSTVKGLICRLNPKLYTYMSEGLYLVVDRVNLVKTVTELLKFYDPEDVQVLGLDSRSYRVYSV